MKSQRSAMTAGVVYTVKSSTHISAYASAFRTSSGPAAGAPDASAEASGAHSGQRCSRYHRTAGLARRAIPMQRRHSSLSLCQPPRSIIRRIWNRSRSRNVWKEYSPGLIQFKFRAIQSSCFSGGLPDRHPPVLCFGGNFSICHVQHPFSVGLSFSIEQNEAESKK